MHEDDGIEMSLVDYLKILAFFCAFLGALIWLYKDSHRRESQMERYNDFQSKEYLCENYPKLKCEIDQAGMIHIKGLY